MGAGVADPIRREVGSDFHLQVKMSAVDHADALFPWSSNGNTLAESVQVFKWAEESGAEDPESAEVPSST